MPAPEPQPAHIAASATSAAGAPPDYPDPANCRAPGPGAPSPGRVGWYFWFQRHPEVRDLAAGWLREQGFEVFTADDGVNGSEMSSAAAAQMVLLGLMIPRLYGYAVCEAIRQDPELKDIVIIVVSSGLSSGYQKAQDVGANAFLHKPFDAAELRPDRGKPGKPLRSG